MKKTCLFLVTALAANLLTAAPPQEALIAAAKNLAEKSNYSWKLTVEEPGRPTATIEGKIQKDGTAFLILARGEHSFRAALKGSKGVLKTDEGWKSLIEAADDPSESDPVRFVARLLENFKVPSAEISNLAAKIMDLKPVDGGYAGTLDNETAKELLLFHMRPDANGLALKDGKGSIKVLISADLISKYEYTIEGTISVNGNDRDVNRTCTLEIKDVGNTKVAIPEDALKKLNG